MTSPDSNSLLKKFYCRDWVFSKLLHCLDTVQKEIDDIIRSGSDGTNLTPRRNGIIIVGGSGAGKTSLCTEIIEPTATQGKQFSLKKRLVAYHFCNGGDGETVDPIELVINLIDQFLSSPLIPEYKAKLERENILEGYKDFHAFVPEIALQQVLFLPLLELPPPKQTIFILIDSIDEDTYISSVRSQVNSSSKSSSSRKISPIEEILANCTDYFPPWLVPIYTARRQNKASAQLSGFRKISLDDLRKPQVVRDVQQYILHRLDSDTNLRSHITRETAEILNTLHIKSNGCFLYLEKVLDGISDNFINIKDIREIPGTLNGLYLWMCQRLFTKKQFSKIRWILSLLLATIRPLNDEDLFGALRTRNSKLTQEDFRKRMNVLERIVVRPGPSSSGPYMIFHHSFAEWCIDIKYCTQKYLCDVSEGHWMLGTWLLQSGPMLSEKKLLELCYHLVNVSPTVLSPTHVPLLLLSSGLNEGNFKIKYLDKLKLDPKVVDLIHELQEEDDEPKDEVDDFDFMNYELDPNEVVRIPGMKNEEPEEFLLDGGGEGPCETEIQLLNGDTQNMEIKETAIIDQPLYATPNHHHTQINSLDEPPSLHGAASSGNVELLEYLLSTELDVNQPDKHGRTALNIASRQGHELVVGLLLDGNAIVDHRDKDGWTALCGASSQGHLKVVGLLLDANANVNNRDRDGATPLLMASFEGHKRVCELLLEYEADIDCCDKAGRNPLWAAASMGHCSVAELLLFWGAYVDHIDGDGRTVLSVAAAQGNVGVVKLLLDRGLDEGHRDNLGWTPLHYAAFEGHQEVCEVLIEAGAKLNDPDNDGYHALLLAAQEGHIHVVEKLLYYGAEVDHRSHDGQTALRVAAIEGFKDIVQLLVNRGANINYCDMDGRSTLYLLALENRVRMAQFLIFCGANVEVRDFEGRTPLHVAAWQGHVKMVELLLSAGAVLDALDNDRRTPLQSAAWEGHENIVKLLCVRGAQVDLMCNQGATALCISVQCGHYECVKALLEFGANPKHSDRSGRTPIKVAMKSGHTSIYRLLEEAILARGDRVGTNTTQRDILLSQHENELVGGVTHSHSHSPHSPTLPPFTSPKLEGKLNNLSLIGGPSQQSQHSMTKTNLLFTKQVQELSNQTRQGGGAGGVPGRLPTSPIYASPPKSPSNNLDTNNGFISPGSDMKLRKVYPGPTESASSNQHQHHQYPQESRITTTPQTQFTSFAFTRDSHMKIILGSNDLSSNFLNRGKKNPLLITSSSSNNNGKSKDKDSNNSTNNSGSGGGSNSTGSGPTSTASNIASNVFRSGLNALKAGMLEATAGKKSSSNEPLLVSAASLAVPINKPKSGHSSSSNSSNTSNNMFLKKETQL